MSEEEVDANTATNSELDNVAAIKQSNAEKLKGDTTESQEQRDTETGETEAEKRDETRGEEEFYRCPYCFLSVPNNTNSIRDHLMLEYSTRGISPLLIQSIFGPTGNTTSNVKGTSLCENSSTIQKERATHSYSQSQINISQTWNTALQQSMHPSSIYMQPNNLTDMNRSVANSHFTSLQMAQNRSQIPGFIEKGGPQMQPSVKSVQSIGFSQYAVPLGSFNRESLNPSLNASVQLGGSPILSPSLGSGIEAVNWCAHCSMTFRLTSDLVQHMRNFHACGNSSSSSDKQIRNQISTQFPTNSTGGLKMNGLKNGKNFKCSSCGECFKERHHLTRHLSSHTTPISRLSSNARYSNAALKHKMQTEETDRGADKKITKLDN